MPSTNAELVKIAEQARAKVEGKTLLIRKCKKRAEKFLVALHTHKKHSPKWERARRKYIFWRRRQHQAIYLKHHWQDVLADAVKRIAENTSLGQKLVGWAEGFDGVREGTAQHRTWVEKVGAALSWPWCSIFVANGIMAVYGWSRSQLPDNPAYSGIWVAWEHARRVSIRKRNRKPGRIFIYDWGDGGMTDHVAIGDGQGGRWGGNQDDAVNRRPEDAEFLVAVVEVRPKN